ncbi:hypothetical protein QAD02_013961 [Eretmocerus hayati]|uniref:Uncharacterized protein n=1 Tax=Eretmocerus hayati TaxID=131215 RepID=A0ACC2P3K2_9HYME|nr:hypothetical protein QAD02_013961 [Eretmocerus hayati]
MSASGPCDYRLKLRGKGRASEALIQHRITAIGYEIYNCAGNSRLVRNKVPALQTLRRKFMEALKNRAAASSDESEDSDCEPELSLEQLEEKLSGIDQAIIKNRRDRAFCHYQTARLEAEIGALHDAQDYYRVPWFRPLDEEQLEVRGYENTLLKDYKEQKKNFIEWRDELLYEAPKLRKDYHEVEGALILELDRLEQPRTAPRERHHQPQERIVVNRDREHREPSTSAQQPTGAPSFTTESANPKFTKLPFGLRQLSTFWQGEKATRRCEEASRKCERVAGRHSEVTSSCFTDDSSSTSSAEGQ